MKKKPGWHNYYMYSVNLLLLAQHESQTS